MTRVVGCTLDHRLQRARRVRTFMNAKDSDVARKIASEAGIDMGTVDATSHVVDVAESAFETLRCAIDPLDRLPELS